MFPLHFILLLTLVTGIQLLFGVTNCFFTYLRKPIEISGDTIVIIDEQPDKNFVLDESNFNEFQEVILMINKMYDVEEEREIISPNEKLKQKFIKARLKLREAKKREREKILKKGTELLCQTLFHPFVLMALVIRCLMSGI